MKLLKKVASFSLAAGIGAALVVITTPQGGWVGAAYGAVGGVLTFAGFLAHRVLAARIGRYTAVAAMSVLLGLIFVALALLSPTCPGSIYVGESCTRTEIGTWLLIGLLLPAGWAAFLFPPAAVGRAGRWLWRRRRDRKTQTEEQTVAGRSDKVQQVRKQDAQRRARKAQRRARKVHRSKR